MSESEVSQIQDEDVLRRMWQATEDFGRKKEIRAHMYRLREERLRSLYSPEPPAAGKGCEFSAAAGHGRSFADQTFQSMKSKEVRDAASPPKEYAYRGQDLKELSNAGWNVESEDRTTDGGRTHVKFVNANIEGQYDVEGGRGQFAAVDKQRRAITEHQDANSSLRRDEASSNTAAHEHVVQQTDDGTRISSTTSSSNTSSKFQQVSSTTQGAMPIDCDLRTTRESDRNERVTRITNTNDYDQYSRDADRNERVTRITNTNDYDPRTCDTDHNEKVTRITKNDYETHRTNESSKAELVSRKVEYPDDNTKVIVETRVLPDGTRVTSTKREFRAPAQSTRSEHQSRSESKSYSSHHSSDVRDNTRHIIDNRSQDIVDSQRHADDHDFKKQLREYTSNDNDDNTDIQRHVTKTNRNVIDHTQTDNEYSRKHYETKTSSKVIDQSTTSKDDHVQTVRHITDRRNDNRVDETDRRHTTSTQDHDYQRNVVKETRNVTGSEQKIQNISRDRKDNEEFIRHVTTDRTVIEDKVRDTSTDRTIPVDRDCKPQSNITRDENSRNEPEKFRDSPMDKTVPQNKLHNIPKDSTIADEKIHRINKNTNVEEVIERKTSSEHYQTTYQNDYQTRKVSTDWSPTHQAWASTLRADTPPTTRPSTRASSPGSKTFKSSTSSLRSSISPDKIYKKPSSRGSSPSKIDRYSPKRNVTSDRYSSSHSSYSVTKERINKSTSPERKPPSGRSPTRPGYSPDRKPQDNHHQRPSASQDKRPTNYSNTPNSSPERNLSADRPKITPSASTKEALKSPMPSRKSPERTKPSDTYAPFTPNRSPSSPDRKSANTYPNRSSPRSSLSPDKQPGYLRNSSPSRPAKRPSTSPDRKPGYMRPTASSQPDDKYHRSPKQDDESYCKDRKSPQKRDTSQSPDRKPQEKTTTTLKKDLYQYVDEETKVYIQKNKTETGKKGTDASKIKESRPCPSNSIIPNEDFPDQDKSSRDTFVLTENKSGNTGKTTETINITSTQDKQNKDITTVKRDNKDITEKKDILSRETSPSIYATYDKKKTEDTELITQTTEDTKNTTYGSLTRRDKTSRNKMADTPNSPSKKSPRDSLSPLKSPTKDTKHKHTSDFISKERTTEDVHKIIQTTKDHPRQLVTPSSSPTRKPKPTETEPSTGQSSPTTSVSGFVYFGSPTRDNEMPVVTDLDEFYPDSANQDETSRRPESLDIKRSPSPSKIPCRSPSPEKYVPSTKDSLPRKSSLKKPSTDLGQTSPIEKPPTSFRVSPSDDIPMEPGHKVVKKDRASEPETGEPVTGEPKNIEKSKPPLQRRETYDDRCKKILGLIDDKTSETVTKETKKYTKRLDSTQTSPSVSPCDSPAPNEQVSFPNYPTSKKTTKVDVTDFISHEQEDLIKTTITPDQPKNKTPSRDASPTKLLDIMPKTTIVTDKTTKDKAEVVESRKTTKYLFPRQNTEKEIISSLVPKEPAQKRSNESPERKRIPSPSKSTQVIQTSPLKNDLSTEKYPAENYPKDITSPAEKYQDKSQSHNTTTMTSILDVTTVDDFYQTTKVTKTSSPTRVLESPTLDTSKRSIDSPERTHNPRTSSPVKNQPSLSSVKKTSPEKNISPVNIKQPRESPEKISGYIKSTTETTTNYDNHFVTEDVNEIHVTRTSDKKDTRKSTSPTRQIPRTRSPTKPPQPSDSIFKLPDLTTQTKPTMHQDDKDVPGYMKTTKTATITSDQTMISEDVHELSKSTIEKKYISSVSPTRSTPSQPKTPLEHRTPSPIKSSRPTDISIDKKQGTSQPSSPVKDSPTKRSEAKYPTESSPTRSVPKVPGYMKPTESMSVKHDTNINNSLTTEDTQETITLTIPDKKYLRDAESPTSNTPQSTDGSTSEFICKSKPKNKPFRSSATSPDRKPSLKSPVKDVLSENENPKHTPERPSSSPERPSYMKPTASITSKFDSKTSHETHNATLFKVGEPKSPSQIKSSSPTRLSPKRESKETSDYVNEPEEPRRLRTPSPTKKTTTIIETNTDFIMSEREQEILNKVQKSLRKLSPERKEKSPSREKSSTKTTTSLEDLDIFTSEMMQNNETMDDNLTEIVEEQLTLTSKVPRPTQLKDSTPKDRQNFSTKPTSRNVSPVKKTQSPPTNKVDKGSESTTKPRSFSPKKSQVERPQSPHQTKTSGIKPRDQIPAHLTRKPTPATLSTTRIERLTTDIKKTNGVTKQTVFTKTTNRSIPSPTGKPIESETKRAATCKSVKENCIPKRDVITRTASDNSMKPKKTSSPQRMKSKPEIKVSDMSTKTQKYQKPIIKEPHNKLASKPKSATSLNTSFDEDDIIIDVQQSKSSRENSPDRICPTPVNFTDDVGVPRFPDEVSEPDDELVKRSHHTIHETESVVDDIVEICEDEELFVKKSDMEVITEQDDSLLSVNDKVNKFTSKIHSVNKPKDATTLFQDTEKRVHSDYIDENLKSDECLLTVSEKVNKFAKGPRDTKESRSPSRKITDEYDRDTVYTDDYTKLSVNDKAHLFVETAENVKTTKLKPAQKIERPDLSNVDESLKSDNCLLSVSDKVTKFVKTAEQYFADVQETEEKDMKIKEQHEKIMRKIIDDSEDESYETKECEFTKDTHTVKDNLINHRDDNSKLPKEPKTTPSKTKEISSHKQVDRISAVKITTLRSSEAVKKAKALFENIASTQKTTQKDTSKKTTKLTDIGVIKKSPKTDSTTVLHPSVENVSPQITYEDDETDMPHTDRPLSGTPTKPRIDDKPRNSPNRLTTQSPEVPRSKSPMRQSVEVTTTKTVLSRYPAGTRGVSPGYRPESPRPRTESPRQRPESEKSNKVPGYLRPTKTSQSREETKVLEETEVSSRRGSGKFGVELRRTSVERSTVSSERRRSVEHHQPCIEDIFDLDLLEQMLEKVVGYEQRRRIRAQIRVAKTQNEHIVESNTETRTNKRTVTVTKTQSPERKVTKSPERVPKSTSQRTSSPERPNKSTPQQIVPDKTQSKEPIMNGHTKEPSRTPTVTRQRPHSPEKPTQKSSLASKTPHRQPSPDKKRTTSPSKVTPKPKGNRFNEYASAYMKKVGLNESDKIKFTDAKNKKMTDANRTVQHETQQRTMQQFTTTKTFTERTSSKDVIEIVQTNGKRSPSPEQRHSPERKVQFPDNKTNISERKAQSPERRPYTPDEKAQSPDRKVNSPQQKAHSPERLYQRTPSPDFKRPKSHAIKETIVKNVYDIEKKKPTKPAQEEKPSWVTSRNLKKITSESRTFSSKKIDKETPKYRAPSPSKVIAKPIDVITSSYGPGPLDADGKPLFGIKALRNGATNFQVKGTVIRQEYHSRNGGAPEGSVSVTAYSSQPEELEQLLATQGEAPSRLHGLAAITTTKKFGGDTGNTLTTAHTKEDRASLEQFTHHDRRVEHLESRIYDSTTQDYGETSIEEITPTRVTDSKRDSRHDNNRSKNREENISQVKRQKVEERREKMEKREDKKTVRQSSVKSLTEKYIKSANDSGKSDRSAYPKAGLILRTTTMRDSVSSDEPHPAGLQRADSEHSVCSVDDTVVTTTTERTGDGVRTTTTRTTHHHHHPTVTTHSTTRGSHLTHHEPLVTTKRTVISQEPVITKTTIVQEPVVTRVTQGRQGVTRSTERSFLDSTTKVTGVQDILTRMKNADIVIQEGDSTEDSEARALLNKFLGATVLMAGMQGYVNEQPEGRVTVRQETVRSSSGGKTSSSSAQELDLDQCWDERLLKKLLEECTDYEQRRRLRARIRTLMAEQEACASAVTEALGAAGAAESDAGADAREEEEVTVTSSVRRDSSDKTVSSTTTRTSKVIEMTRPAPKPVSPFAKFRQLEKQNSTNSPNSPKTPQSPGSPSQPYFKFTDPALQCSALTIKERLLQWCRDKTRDYENVKLENFSTSWADGLAFCALVHHFLPDAFDYSKLTPDKRRHNFTLAFKVADEKAGIYPLLDVDDMVAMRKPDWKCVFTYVQAIYRRFKDEQ